MVEGINRFARRDEDLFRRPTGARAFSLLEVLVAVGIMALALTPIVTMASHSVDALRGDRTRLFAEALCHDTLERLGSSQSFPAQLLGPSADPSVLVASDPWNSNAGFFQSMGYDRLDLVAARVHLQMALSLRMHVAPELDLLICEVRWSLDGSRRPEHVTYSRFLTYGHIPIPR